jgi:hypothetical protein
MILRIMTAEALGWPLTTNLGGGTLYLLILYNSVIYLKERLTLWTQEILCTKHPYAHTFSMCNTKLLVTNIHNIPVWIFEITGQYLKHGVWKFHICMFHSYWIRNSENKKQNQGKTVPKWQVDILIILMS